MDRKVAAHLPAPVSNTWSGSTAGRAQLHRAAPTNTQPSQTRPIRDGKKTRWSGRTGRTAERRPTHHDPANPGRHNKVSRGATRTGIGAAGATLEPRCRGGTPSARLSAVKCRRSPDGMEGAPAWSGSITNWSIEAPDLDVTTIATGIVRSTRADAHRDGVG